MARSDDIDLADRLRLSMIRLGRQLRRRDASELTITQISALSTVVRSGPLSVGQLADIEVLPSPAATRLADKLEEAGLVERRRNPVDRRGVLVACTAKGAELITRSEQVRNAWLAQRLGTLNDADRRALSRAVGVIEKLVVSPRGAREEPEGARQ